MSENNSPSLNRERSPCYNTVCEHNKPCNTGCACLNKTVDKGRDNVERCGYRDEETEFKHVVSCHCLLARFDLHFSFVKLCLRKWRDVRLSCEFRCFVWEDRIIGGFCYFCEWLCDLLTFVCSRFPAAL